MAELSAELQRRLTVHCINLPAPLNRYEGNVEIWLTYLSQPHPWLAEEDNLQNKALFLRISKMVAEILNERTDAVLSRKCPEWLHRLCEYWHSQQSVVISFNYDILIERAVGLLPIRSNSGNRISPENIYPVQLTEVSRRNATIVGDGNVDTLKLFKLHGSINWYYSGAPSYFGEVLYYSTVAPWGSDRTFERQGRAEAYDKTPRIVPPTTEKAAYFQHEGPRRIWSMATEALHKASNVLCLGYSLPPTDLGVRFFLDFAGGEGIPMKIVDISSDVVRRYEAIIGKSFFASSGTRDCPETSQPIPWFVDQIAPANR